VHEDIIEAFKKYGVKEIAFEKLCVERDNWEVGSPNTNVDINLG
jgi:hypothetical protein